MLNVIKVWTWRITEMNDRNGGWIWMRDNKEIWPKVPQTEKKMYEHNICYIYTIRSCSMCFIGCINIKHTPNILKETIWWVREYVKHVDLYVGYFSMYELCYLELQIKYCKSKYLTRYNTALKVEVSIVECRCELNLIMENTLAPF